MSEDELLKMYGECLEHMVDAYKIQLDTMKRFIIHFKKGKYPLPNEKQKRHIKTNALIVNVTKEPNDPFDTIYNIFFVTRLSSFEFTFNECLKEHKIQYDLNSYLDKELLLKDFGSVVERYNIKPKINIVNKKIEIGFRFFLTKTDIIIV